MKCQPVPGAERERSRHEKPEPTLPRQPRDLAPVQLRVPAHSFPEWLPAAPSCSPPPSLHGSWTGEWQRAPATTAPTGSTATKQTSDSSDNTCYMSDRECNSSSLEDLPSSVLATRLDELMTRERHCRAEFLVHLAALDRRRGYLELGYKSLFVF